MTTQLATSPMQIQQKPLHAALLAAGIVFLTRLPFLWPGYGIHQDGWMLINAARWMSAHPGHYICSRLPGYPFQEFATLAFWRGGPLVVNGVTALMCAALVFFFVLVLGKLRCRDAVLAGVALAFVPMAYLSSVMAKDYLWAVAFAMAALYFALQRRPTLAGLLLGLGMGTRLTTVGLLPFLLLLLLRPHEEDEDAGRVPANTRQKVIASLTMSACTLLVGGLCFLPVYLHFGRGFFTYYPAKMQLISIVANATINFWGVTGMLALLIAFGSLLHPAVRRGASSFAVRPGKVHIAVWAGICLAYGCLFLKLPLESAYLLPALPFALLLLAHALPRRVFQLLCIALIVAPFLLTFRRDANPPSPAVAGARIAGYQWRLYWAGPLLDDALSRRRQQRYLRDLLAFAEAQQRPTVIVAVWNMPMIDLQVLDRGGRLVDVPPSERPHPWCWERSFHAVDHRGLVQFRCLLTRAQFDTLQQQGYAIYCVPDMRWSFQSRLDPAHPEFDPFTHGCELVPIGTFKGE